MPLDPDDPSRIFVHALAGQFPTTDQLLSLDPRSLDPAGPSPSRPP